MLMDWMKQPEQTKFPWNKGTFLDPHAADAAQRNGKYKDVPLIVAPGKEDEYLEIKARQETEAKMRKRRRKSHRTYRKKGRSRIQEHPHNRKNPLFRPTGTVGTDYCRVSG